MMVHLHMALPGTPERKSCPALVPSSCRITIGASGGPLRWNRVAALQYLTGGDREDGDTLFTRVQHDRTRGSSTGYFRDNSVSM